MKKRCFRCFSFFELCLFYLIIQSASVIDSEDIACPKGWHYFDEYCYLISKERLSLLSASLHCFQEDEDSELVYISSEAEQNFLLSLIREANNKTEEFLIGFTQLVEPHYWTWFNRSRPVNYLNWEAGSFHVGGVMEYCAVMDNQKGSWVPGLCPEPRRFICKRLLNTSESSPSPIMPTPSETTNSTYGCLRAGEKNWFHFESRCYYVSKEPKSWNEAQDLCNRMDSDLVALHSTFETHTLLLVSKYPEFNAPETLWIGMKGKNTSATGRLYEWVNGEEVIHTDWDAMEPNNFMSSEDCVYLDTKTKQWSDGDCQVTRSFACVRDEVENETSNPSTSPLPISTDRCPVGYPGYIHGDSCYHLYDSPEPVDHAQAQAACNSFSNDSHLLYIMSENEQDMIHYLLGFNNIHDEEVWMGFHGSYFSSYKWISGHKVKYYGMHSDWHVTNVDHCGVLLTTHYLYSLWNMVDCKKGLFKFICKAPAKAIPSTPDSKEKEPVCKDDWTYLDNGRCFKITDIKVDWIQAQEFCSPNQLVIIKSPEENTKLHEHLKATNHTFADYWIGMSGMLEYHYLVGGDTPQYTEWAPGEPNVAAYPLFCVKVDRSSGKWFAMRCDEVGGVVCEQSVVDWRTATTTSTLPTTLSTTKATKKECSEGFQSLTAANGRKICYSAHEQSVSWNSAREICLNKNSDLLSIHSPDMFTLLKLSESSQEFWIGLQDIGFYAGYEWSDKSPLDHLQWDENEPKQNQKTAQCGYLVKKTSSWKTSDCTATKPFICYKQHLSSNTEPISPPTNKGYCPEGFFKSLSTPNSCFKVFKAEETKALTWDQARTFCEKLHSPTNTRLAQLHSHADQALATVLMRQSNVSTAWLGLYGIQKAQSFTFQWIDENPVTYVNWGSEQPHLRTTDKERCVRMTSSLRKSTPIGQWENVDCDSLSGVMCMTDSLATVPQPTKKPPAEDHCDSGYVALKPSWCVAKSLELPSTFADLQKKCHSNHILTIRDADEQALFENYLHQLPESEKVSALWLGINEKKNPLQWLDEKAVTFTNWNSSEVLHNEYCSAVTNGGKWIMRSCTEAFAGLCEIRKAEQQATATPVHQPTYHCLNSSWTLIGTDCYSPHYLTQRVDYFQAHQQCQSLNSHLVSIHSDTQMQFIQDLIANVTNKKTDFPSIWIALVKNFKGGLRWSDDAALNYIHWRHDTIQNGNCFLLDATTSEWIAVECEQKNGFLCHQDAITLTDSDSDHFPVPFTAGISRLDIILIIILFGLFILTGGLLFSYLHRRKLQRSRGTMMVGRGFGNVYFSPGVDEVVVHDGDTLDFGRLNDDYHRGDIQ